MKLKNRTNEYAKLRQVFFACLFSCVLLFTASCNELEKPKPEPFYAETEPPRKQEFRWSNGKMPKSFDPAKASAPPETDIVRAVFEGLTDNDAKTLEVVPAIAEKWTASEDFKIWTFHLRKDAKWSNGEPVTAQNFVLSWQRLVEMGEQVPQRNLLKNIVGMDAEKILPVFADEKNKSDTNTNTATNISAQTSSANINANVVETNSGSPEKEILGNTKTNFAKKKKNVFGVEAVDKFTLKVSLVQPDKYFPALVAHPIFRPVFGDGKELEKEDLNAGVVTNGAFRIASVGRDGVTLDRAENFWNKEAVSLERVRFVPTENAEKALQAYKSGELDAITNADFEPLALKLLTPFEDFRLTLHSAINYYRFNQTVKPFDDLRVREALTISIEREKLTEADTDGATEPALNYSPFDTEKIVQDTERAKKLLADAGFPNGENFPTVRLLINRNDLQKRIARSVAKMWEKNLNVKCEIIIKDSLEFDTAIKNGEFDLVRRGAVLPTTNETFNMSEIFPDEIILPEQAKEKPSETNTNTNVAQANLAVNQSKEQAAKDIAEKEIFDSEKPVLTSEEAIAELPAIPLYFPTSNSLVKPYVQGFELNALDAPSLKTVRIDSNWQPKRKETKSN